MGTFVGLVSRPALPLVPEYRTPKCDRATGTSYGGKVLAREEYSHMGLRPQGLELSDRSLAPSQQHSYCKLLSGNK